MANSTHNEGDDEATRLALEQAAWLRFMRQVLTPLPREDLFNDGGGDGEAAV